MKDLIYKKLIVYLVLLQPIIDIVTSYMVIEGYSLTIGIIVKLLILCLACIYLVFLDKKRWKINFLMLAILAIFSGFNIWNNLSIIKITGFEYFNYLFKYLYHLIILLFFIRWYKNYGIKLYQLRIPILIVAGSFFLALITKTSYPSYFYSSTKLGYSGWYSSANELGNLLCLLYPISIYNAFHNKDGIKLDIVLCVLSGACMLFLGTKVGLVGFLGVSFGYIIIRILFVNKMPINKGVFIVLFMATISLFLFNEIPAVHNIKYVSENTSNDVDYLLLSGRSDFLKAIMEKYKESNVVDKLVGKTYYGAFKGEEESIMIVEQDFYDIFFMYGYVGIAIVLLAYMLVYIEFIRKFFAYYRNRKSLSKKYLTVIVAITLELAVAFISGHSLLSPSVSTYLTLLVALSFSLEFKNENIEKKNVLVSANSSFYKKIDQDKYDVTLLMTSKQNIVDYSLLYPYYTNKVNGKNKFLFNKVTAYLLTRNQRYDIVLADNNNSSFDNYYLRYAVAQRKLIVGKNSNKLFKEKISKMEINKL